MLARRLLIVLAVLMALPRSPPASPRASRARDDAAESPRAGGGAGRGPARAHALGRRRRADRRIAARRGRHVRLTVEGDEVDSVELGELEVEPIDPESPALFELLADELATYPITLLDAERRIGVLEMRGVASPGA